MLSGLRAIKLVCLNAKKEVLQTNSSLVKKRNRGCRVIPNLRSLNAFSQKYKVEIILGNPSAVEEQLGGFFDHLLAGHMIPV